LFENRVLRILCGPERDEMTGLRKPHNEELHSLYCSPNIIKDDQIKEDVMSGTCSAHEEMRTTYNISVGKSEEKRTLERPRRRWEDNIKMDFKE
jgi:hypothetical protein